MGPARVLAHDSGGESLYANAVNCMLPPFAAAPSGAATLGPVLNTPRDVPAVQTP